MNNNKLYCILVPTKYGDTLKPIRTKHHKEWDKRIIKITKGLTILEPGKGKWVFNNIDYNEKVIPVLVMCDESFIEKLIDITIKHYRQKAVMWYVVSNEVNITKS